MRPLDTEEPTHEEEVAAERLAEETKAQTARYVDYEAAIADGYVPDGPELGRNVTSKTRLIRRTASFSNRASRSCSSMRQTARINSYWAWPIRWSGPAIQGRKSVGR